MSKGTQASTGTSFGNMFWRIPTFFCTMGAVLLPRGAHLHAVVAPLKSPVWAEAQVPLPQTIMCQRNGFKIFPQNLPYYCKSSRCPFWKTDPTG